MNKKGQTVEGIVLVFIVILVGVILFQAIAQQVGTVTNTVTVANTTLATTVNGTAQYLVDYQSLTDVVIYNATGNLIIGSGNYTVTNNFVNNGALTVKILPNVNSAIYLSAWKVSGTAQPVGYISDGGSRSVASLIAIFFALGIAVVALLPVTQGKILEMIGK